MIHWGYPERTNKPLLRPRNHQLVYFLIILNALIGVNALLPVISKGLFYFGSPVDTHCLAMSLIVGASCRMDCMSAKRRSNVPGRRQTVLHQNLSHFAQRSVLW